MRTLSKALLAASVPAFAFAAPAQAAGGGQMNGVVQPVCQVNDLFASISFPSMTTGASISDSVELECNDADGAEVTLIRNRAGA